MMGLSLGNLWVHLGLDASNYLKNLNLAQSKLMAAGKQMEAAGRTMTRKLTMPIVAVGVTSVRAFAKFEEQMANVSTMLDEQTMQYMPMYTEAVKDMSIEFGEGTETITKGLYDILSASIAPADAIDVLAVSMKAAKAGMTTTAAAADVITTILNSYSMSADEASRVSDVLFATVKKGKITFDQLASNIGMVASVASTAGLSIEEVGAAIATMTRAGMPAARATTALRSIISGMLKPMDDAKKVAKEFGLELSSNTLQTIGLTGVIVKLKDASAEQIAAIFPNIRAMTGLAAQVKQVAGQLEDLQFMFDATGKTQEAYEKMTNTLMHSLRQLWRLIVVVGIEIGDALRPAIESMTKSIKTGLQWWRSLSDETKALIGKFVLIAAVVGPVLLIFGKLATSLGFMIMSFKMLIPLLSGIIGAFGGLVTVLGPVLIVIGLVVAAAYTLRAAWNQNVEAIKARLEALANFFKQAFDYIANSVIGDFIRWLVTAIPNALKKVKEDVANFAKDLGGIFRGIKALAKGENFWDAYVEGFDQAKRDLASAKKAVVETYETGALYIKAYGEATAEHLSELGDALKTQVNEDMNAVINLIKDKLTELQSQDVEILPAEDIAEIKRQIQELNDELGKVASQGTYAFTNLKEHIQDASHFMENLEFVLTRAFDSVSDTLTDLVMTGKADFKELAESILRDFTNMIIKMQMAKLLTAAIPSLGENTEVAAMTAAGTQAATAISTAGTTAATALSTSGTTAATALTTSGTSAAGAMTAAGTSSAAALTTAGATVSSSIVAAGATAAAAITAASASSAIGGAAGAGSALGNIFSHGKIIPAANGMLINQPTLFPMANNEAMLGGERGDEAIMPLGRTRGNKLGVYAEQSQQPVTVKLKNINVYDKSEMYAAMQTDEGEQILWNFLGKIGVV